MQDTSTQQRIHITFGKFEALKYTSNLDIAKIWERVLRRAKLPISYTKGFNTRPKIQLATALPLGITSECEIIDVSLRESISLEGVAEKLLAVSPGGLKIYNIEEAILTSSPLQNLVRSAEYRVSFMDDIDRSELQHKIDDLLAQDRIIKTHVRKHKKHISDLRPMIHDLTIDGHGHLIAHLATGGQGNVRLEHIMEELQIQDAFFKAHRYKLHIEPYR